MNDVDKAFLFGFLKLMKDTPDMNDLNIEYRTPQGVMLELVFDDYTVKGFYEFPE
jgi:hypothetical protein